MERKFKVGDVVKLNSGGEPMTVLNYMENTAPGILNTILGQNRFDETNTETAMVRCRWMYKGKDYIKNFDEATLTLVELK